MEREFQKTYIFVSIDHKSLDQVIMITVKILGDNRPSNLPLRNLFAVRKATVGN